MRRKIPKTAKNSTLDPNPDPNPGPTRKTLHFVRKKSRQFVLVNLWSSTLKLIYKNIPRFPCFILDNNLGRPVQATGTSRGDGGEEPAKLPGDPGSELRLGRGKEREECEESRRYGQKKTRKKLHAAHS